MLALWWPDSCSGLTCFVEVTKLASCLMDICGVLERYVNRCHLEMETVCVTNSYLKFCFMIKINTNEHDCRAELDLL